MVKKEKVLSILHELGGCHATDSWSRGWDEAIDTAYDEISKLEEDHAIQHIKKLEQKLHLLERENKALAIEGEEKCEKLERLEKALDKACEVIVRHRLCRVTDTGWVDTKEQWKEELLKDE